MERKTFQGADYTVFVVMLVISGTIGIYFGLRSRKSKHGTSGYLMASRSMTFLPVAISLTTSFTSSLALLTIPAEIYFYGTMIMWINISYVIVVFTTAEIFIPTFYRLGISSTYEYLEMRFNRLVRIMGTLSFIIVTIFYMGVVIYNPALAFGAVTNFPIWVAIVATGVICTIYTTVGGLRGVIWSDVFQAFVMFSGIIAMLIKGSILFGGYENIWSIAERGGRIDFAHFETDPRIRNTVWSIVIGGSIRWSGLYAVGQSQVQRYLSCRSEKEAKRSAYLNLFGLVSIIVLVGLLGLLVYAYYEGCDPLRSKCIQKGDQLVPYLVLDMFSTNPGAAGLYVSAVYAASLSSVSSGINAMAAVAMQDLIKPYTKYDDTKYKWISQGLVLLFGLLSIGMAFLLSTAKELLQAAISLTGMIMGPLVGLFLLAIQFPFVNSAGAISGLISGLAAAVWYYIGRTTIQKSSSLIRNLPASTDTCGGACSSSLFFEPSNTTTMESLTTTMSYEMNISSIYDFQNYSSPPEAEPTVFGDDVPFYNLSYHYISAIGLGFTMTVGIVVSLATCGWRQRKQVNPALLRPPFDHWLVRPLIPEKVRRILRFGIEWEDNISDKSEDVPMTIANENAEGNRGLAQ